jgi:hypothetical protein
MEGVFSLESIATLELLLLLLLALVASAMVIFKP